MLGRVVTTTTPRSPLAPGGRRGGAGQRRSVAAPSTRRARPCSTSLRRSPGCLGPIPERTVISGPRPETLDEGAAPVQRHHRRLDEAASPEQARAIIDQVVLPRSRRAPICALGSRGNPPPRRRGNLLDRFRRARERSTSMTQAISPGRTSPPTPGQPGAGRRRAARETLPRDGCRAGRRPGRRDGGPTFLVAGLIARTRGLHDRNTVTATRSASRPPWTRSWPATWSAQPGRGSAARSDRAGVRRGTGCPPGCGSPPSRRSRDEGQAEDLTRFAQCRRRTSWWKLAVRLLSRA